MQALCVSACRYKHMVDIKEVPKHRLAEIRWALCACIGHSIALRIKRSVAVCTHRCSNDHLSKVETCTQAANALAACNMLSTPGTFSLLGAAWQIPLCCRRFFEDYKKNENKEVEVEEIHGAAEAKKVISDAIELYKDQYMPKRKR